MSYTRSRLRHNFLKGFGCYNFKSNSDHKRRYIYSIVISQIRIVPFATKIILLCHMKILFDFFLNIFTQEMIFDYLCLILYNKLNCLEFYGSLLLQINYMSLLRFFGHCHFEYQGYRNRLEIMTLCHYR